MTAGRCARTLRAAVFAAVCVLLAALGHVMMSGAPVAWWALAGGAVATGGACWCLAGRERGRTLIVSVVVAVQTALHEAFSLAQSWAPQARPPAATGHDMSAMTMARDPATPMDTAATAMDPMTAMDAVHTTHPHHLGHAAHDGSSFGMLAAHLLAALLCGLWLAYGERAAFRILRAAAGRLAAPLRMLSAVPVLPCGPRHRVRRRSRPAPRRLPLVHAVTSRGPPVGTAVR
ncbi:hypothetical protein [Streptomyces phaeofaciens]|uniref:hypothetical protein n=1 Tax=Streptomyces phaeofaciens TaxID=68254 RepID=UPI00368B812B